MRLLNQSHFLNRLKMTVANTIHDDEIMVSKPDWIY
jgi:hypothetical protein